MPEPCGRTFEEVLLSGYLDDALVQGDEQRVRVHLEDCATCRTLVDELAAAREATMSSTFDTPRDHEWSEVPRTETSRFANVVGWPLVIGWTVLVGGYALWSLWTDAESWIEQLLVVGGVSGFGLLFLRALLDRRHAMKTDWYREVKR
jgi:anti-sigma factor RsiW